MRRSRFSVEQIVAVLKQVELGLAVADACRKMGISEQTVEARGELTRGGCGQKLGLVMRRCPGADDAGRDCESPVSS